MKRILVVIALASLASPAVAHEDEMMGTIVNGRVESRNERSYRVQDPQMDREEMIIDREKRQGRNTVDPESSDPRLHERKPFQGKLPD